MKASCPFLICSSYALGKKKNTLRVHFHVFVLNLHKSYFKVKDEVKSCGVTGIMLLCEVNLI